MAAPMPADLMPMPQPPTDAAGVLYAGDKKWRRSSTAPPSNNLNLLHTCNLYSVDDCTFHVLQVDSIITILLKLLAVWRQSPWRMAVKYYLSPKDDDEAASMHTNMHQNSRHCCISHFASTATSTSSSSAEIY